MDPASSNYNQRHLCSKSNQFKLKDSIYREKAQRIWEEKQQKEIEFFNFEPSQVGGQNFQRAPKNACEATLFFLFCSHIGMLAVSAEHQRAHKNKQEDATSKVHVPSHLPEPRSNGTYVPLPILEGFGQARSTQEVPSLATPYKGPTDASRPRRRKGAQTSQAPKDVKETREIFTHQKLGKYQEQAEAILKIVKGLTPYKLNRFDDSPVIRENQEESPTQLSEEEISHREAAMKELMNLSSFHVKSLGANLKKELTSKWRLLLKNHKITRFDDERIVKYIDDLIGQVTLLQDLLVYRDLGEQFRGGNCQVMAYTACIETLRLEEDIPIEVIIVNDPTQSAYSHVFIVVGERAEESLLNDPRTWGDNVWIIDPWASDRVISIRELIKHPEKYEIYLRHWPVWKSRVLSKKLPKPLDNDPSYVKKFHEYAQKKYDKQLKDGVHIPLS